MNPTSLSSAEARTEEKPTPDMSVWIAAAGFLASGLGLAAFGVSFAVTAGLAVAASAGSIWLARARSAVDVETSILVDRALQGILSGVLLWLVQLLVAQTPFGIAGLAVAVPFVFVAFVGLTLAETAAAGLICAFVRPGGPAPVSAAILIDNRAFGTLGTLKR